MKAEILKLLREADGYVSGQQLCEKFGVSRTAVWKVIRQLQEEGYQVEAVRNKGYHIVDSPDVMTKEELDSLMDTQWAGRNIVTDEFSILHSCIKMQLKLYFTLFYTYLFSTYTLFYAFLLFLSSLSSCFEHQNRRCHCRI